MNRIEPAFSDNKTAILFSANNIFIKYAAVMIESIIEQSKQDKKYDLVVMHSDISVINQGRVVEMAENKENISIRFCNVLDKIESYEFYIERKDIPLSQETYYRLLAGDILSEQFDKVIYLDGDMVTVTDIAELYDVDVKDYYIAAVRDASSVGLCHSPNNDRIEYRQKVLKLDNPDDYFIAGLLVMNLKRIREDYPAEKLLEIATKTNWLQHDQDVLNHICRGGNIRIISSSWNVSLYHEALEWLPENLMEEWRQSQNEPKVIHYCGRMKPWNIDMKRQEEFWKYAVNTPFLKEIILKIAPKATEDDIKVIRDGLIRKEIKPKYSAITKRLEKMSNNRKITVRAKRKIKKLLSN